MTMPFSPEQFFGIFDAYNRAIWPIQIVALIAGAVGVALLWSRPAKSARPILAILALLWLVNGIGYHAAFFVRINPVAWLFAGAFLLQGAMFAAAAGNTSRLTFQIQHDVRSRAGLAMIGYALFVYPVLGIWAGHGFLAGPMFGVAPCPTTIFTIGLLMMARGRWTVLLSAIPILWSAVGLAAAIQLKILEDLGLPVAGLILAIMLSSDTLRERNDRNQKVSCPE